MQSRDTASKINRPRTENNAACRIDHRTRRRLRVTTAFLLYPLDARKQTISLVEDEIDKQPTPGSVIFERIVKFRRARAQLGQPVPRNRRKIVMLIVVSDIERDEIDRAVVAKRFLVSIVSIMFLNPACANWMQADRQET